MADEELQYTAVKGAFSLPSYFGEDDAARLQRQQALLEQQTEVAGSYQGYEQKPWYERAARAVGAWLPLEKLPVPMFQYGLTPGETAGFATQTAAEVDDLLRKQRVTIEAQRIIETINMFRTAGITAANEGQLESLLDPIQGVDWSQEDRDWMMDYAKKSLLSTTEGGLAGEPTGFNPEDLLTPTKEGQMFLTAEERSLVASTVAFSKDISTVLGALREMYTPITPTKEQAQDDLTANVKLWFGQTGLNYDEDKTVQENYLVLQDYLDANKMSLVAQWDWLKQNDPVAYEQQIAQYKFTPYPRDENNNPVYNPSEQNVIEGFGYVEESQAKDSWDDLVVAGRGGMALPAKRTFGAILPSYLLYSEIPSFEEEQSIWSRTMEVILSPVPWYFMFLPDNVKVVLNKYTEEKRAGLAAKNALWTEEFEKWYKEHPDLAPRPEYEQGIGYAVGQIIKNPDLLPGYLSHLFIRQGLPTLTGVAISTGVTLATKNPVLGGVIASAWFIPQNIDSLQQDLLSSGATWEQATRLSVPIGLAISAVEGLGDIPYLRALNPAFTGIVRDSVTGEFVKLTTRQLLRKGIRTAMYEELTETLEEVVQQVMQNATVKTIDRSRGIFDDIPETVLQTLVMVAPFSLFSGGMSIKNVYNNLPVAEMQKVHDKVTTMMEEEGVTEEQAYLTTITHLGETQEGLEVVEAAVEKTKAQEPLIREEEEAERLVELKSYVGTKKWLDDTLRTRDWAVISAEANAKERMKLDANKLKALNTKRGEELRAYLADKTPYSFYPTVWVENGVEGEQSFFVEGIDAATASQIGTMFKQDGVYVPFGWLNKDGTYHPGDLANVSVDGLDSAKTVVTVNGEKHGFSVPTDFKQKLKYEEVYNPIAREKMLKRLAKKYGLEVINEDPGVDIMDSEYHDEGGETWIDVGTDNIENYVTLKKDSDKQAIIDLILAHELNHHLDPKVRALSKGKGEIQREINAWKGALADANKYGIQQNDAVRLVREFVQHTRYEGLLTALVKAGVLPEEVPILPLKTKTGEMVELSGIPTDVPKGYSMITGLEQYETTAYAGEGTVTGETTTGEATTGEVTVTGMEEGTAAVAEGETVSEGVPSETVTIDPFVDENMAELDTTTTSQPPLPPVPEAPVAPQPASWWSKKKKSLGELIRDIQTLKYTFMDFDKMTKRTGAKNSYYQLSYDTELVSSAANGVSKKSLDIILHDPQLSSIITDPVALAKIEQELRARNPKIVEDTGEGHPTLTSNEMNFANTVERILKARELPIRYRRFVTSWDAHRGNVDAILEDIPDGNVAEFRQAGQFIESNDENGLLNYLSGCTWGVMQSGYTPTQVFYPNVMRRQKWTDTIGFGALQQRRQVVLPEMEANLWQRLVKYVTQQDLAFRMTPFMKQANRMLQADMHRGVLSVRQVNEMTNTISDYFDTMLQRRSSRSAATQFAMNIAGQSYTTIFETYPVLALRNAIQGMVFYWDRPHLLASMRLKGSEIENIFFNSKSSEMEGIRRDALLRGESHTPRVLKPLNRLADWIGLFSRSETLSRKGTFHAAYTKALAANQKFLEAYRQGNADVGKWLKDSDAWVFETPQRTIALNYLLKDRTSMGIPGLTNITGAEASALYLADQAVDTVHYRYTRWYRGKYEHGDVGKVLFGLSTYPKSYAEMMVRRLNKMNDPALPASVRTKALYEAMAIVTVGMIAAGGLTKLTGKKTKSYSPWDMFNWSFGGLTLGVLQDLTGTIYTLMRATLGDKESQNQALSTLGRDIAGLAREYIPWYQQTMYLLETALGTEYIDTVFMRKFLGMIDDNYSPQDMKEVERGWFEKFQHALFGGAAGEQVKPTVIEAGLTTITDAEKQLGKLDKQGNIFTLRDYATKVRAVERDVPSGVISEEYGFSDLSLYYIDCEDYIQQEYLDKYANYSASDKGKLRRSAREQNPNLDAILYFWGQVDTVLTTQARDIVNSLYEYFHIPASARW